MPVKLNTNSDNVIVMDQSQLKSGFLRAFVDQAEEEIERSRKSGEFAMEAPLLKRIITALKTQDRTELMQTVADVRSRMPAHCRSILATLLDCIDSQVLRGQGKVIRCPSCGDTIPSLIDYRFLARLTCPTCYAELVMSGEISQLSSELAISL